MKIQKDGSKRALTELEGAILGVLRRAPSMTPYAVRRVFSGSRSAEWGGSAGAVYPAMLRLTDLGLLHRRDAKDNRGSSTYTLTTKGTAAHDQWLCDVERAIGPGVDPFRTRAGFWSELSAVRRRSLTRALTTGLRRERDELQAALPFQDPCDTIVFELHVALLDQRLAWLKAGAGT